MAIDARRTQKSRHALYQLVAHIRKPMLKTVKAVLEKDGSLHLLEEVELSQSKRVLVVFLDGGDDEEGPAETALLSEASLGQDWNREEEDAAWQHLQ